MPIDPEDFKELEKLYRESLEDLTDCNKGYMFFRIRGDLAEDFGPNFRADFRGWMDGFVGAMARHARENEFPSIQAALTQFGINGLPLETLLRVAEEFEKAGDFKPWPKVPIRGGPRGWQVIQGGIASDASAVPDAPRSEES